MGKLAMFNTITLDGYFTGENGDLSWAHEGADHEWNEYVSGNAQGDGTLLFGRITYDMMVSFWPTPQAKQAMPEVAEGMNRMHKYVVSKSMDHASWNNTHILKGDLATEVRKLKQEKDDIQILGSGSVVAQLAQAGLIDEYSMVVKPVVIGKGRTLFEGVDRKISLKRRDTRTFKNGNVVIRYEPW